MLLAAAVYFLVERTTAAGQAVGAAGVSGFVVDDEI